ncbi:MAG: S-methyl-5-thioribose-1-phosphate isomerase [Myxococcales bacterium]|nr:S-methyl-5-thioribose-1-phosphate isomerase [Myxococcales bacterium]MCB9626695.1 S-methyl-5-thioribose-1-phosphate isomerase [Sandaracinaceae bacterium]
MFPTLSREPLSQSPWFAVEYEPRDHSLWLLDQRALPTEVAYLTLRRPDEAVAAIRDMAVRGAPAIGITAAYALAQQAYLERGAAPAFMLAMGTAGRVLNATRPTAVNLAWAIARMARKAADVAHAPADERAAALLAEAEAIHREDVAACREMGRLGAEDVPDGACILTHCNAGALATGGYGTALGVIRAAHEAGKRVRVLADETRPYLQGARLTSWELHQDGIPVEVITDSTAAHCFQRGEIDFVVVGADRVAKNGDVANKIGTYGVAVLADVHGVPFTVAAPVSTLDFATPSGDLIPLEERSRREVAQVGAQVLVADGIACRHVGFDVTPARLVKALYTERGVVRLAAGEALGSLFPAR